MLEGMFQSLREYIYTTGERQEMRAERPTSSCLEQSFCKVDAFDEIQVRQYGLGEVSISFSF